MSPPERATALSPPPFEDMHEQNPGRRVCSRGADVHRYGVTILGVWFGGYCIQDALRVAAQAIADETTEFRASRGRRAP